MSISAPTPTAAVDERRPLLADNPSTGANAGIEAAVDVDVEAEDPIKADAVVQEKLSWWAIFWYALLAIAGAAILGVFIKGFIDADDVEVCTLWKVRSSIIARDESCGRMLTVSCFRV